MISLQENWHWSVCRFFQTACLGGMMMYFLHRHVQSFSSILARHLNIFQHKAACHSAYSSADEVHCTERPVA